MASLEEIVTILQYQSEKRLEEDLEKIISYSQEIKFLKNLEKDLQLQCAKYMHHEYIRNKEILFHQGQIGNKFYIVLNGQVDVLLKRYKNGKQEVIRATTLGKGNSLGELALLSENNKRKATIQAVSEEGVHFGVLNKQSYLYILKSQQEKNIYREMDYMFKNPIFGEWKKRRLKDDVYLAQTTVRDVKVHKNEKIYSEGSIVEYVYLIKEGEFARIKNFKIVPKDENGNNVMQYQHPLAKTSVEKKELTIQKLGQYEIFGEDEIIQQRSQRHHGIKCISQEGVLLQIEKHIFKAKVLDRHDESRHAFQEIVKKRQIQDEQQEQNIIQLLQEFGGYVKKDINGKPQSIDLTQQIQQQQKQQNMTNINNQQQQIQFEQYMQQQQQEQQLKEQQLEKEQQEKEYVDKEKQKEITLQKVQKELECQEDLMTHGSFKTKPKLNVTQSQNQSASMRATPIGNNRQYVWKSPYSKQDYLKAFNQSQTQYTSINQTRMESSGGQKQEISDSQDKKQQQQQDGSLNPKVISPLKERKKNLILIKNRKSFNMKSNSQQSNNQNQKEEQKEVQLPKVQQQKPNFKKLNELKKLSNIQQYKQFEVKKAELLQQQLQKNQSQRKDSQQQQLDSINSSSQEDSKRQMYTDLEMEKFSQERYRNKVQENFKIFLRMNHWDLMQEGNFKDTCRQCPDNLYIKMLNWEPPIDQMRKKKQNNKAKVSSISIKQLPDQDQLLDEQYQDYAKRKSLRMNSNSMHQTEKDKMASSFQGNFQKSGYDNEGFILKNEIIQDYFPNKDHINESTTINTDRHRYSVRMSQNSVDFYNQDTSRNLQKSLINTSQKPRNRYYKHSLRLSTKETNEDQSSDQEDTYFKDIECQYKFEWQTQQKNKSKTNGLKNHLQNQIQNQVIASNQSKTQYIRPLTMEKCHENGKPINYHTKNQKFLSNRCQKQNFIRPSDYNCATFMKKFSDQNQRQKQEIEQMNTSMNNELLTTEQGNNGNEYFLNYQQKIPITQRNSPILPFSDPHLQNNINNNNSNSNRKLIGKYQTNNFMSNSNSNKKKNNNNQSDTLNIDLKQHAALNDFDIEFQETSKTPKMLYESRYSKKDERLQKLAKPKEHYIPRYNLGL